MIKKGAFVLGAGALDRIYGAEEQADAARLIELVAPPLTGEEAQAHPERLAEADVLLSGWGAPRLDAAFLAATPRLKLLLYGAGSVRGTVTDAMWERGIQVSSAVSMNAIPVTEYTLAMILFGLKRGWQQERMYRSGQTRDQVIVAGAYGGTVGLVSLGTIGRLLCERLRAFDMHVVAYDPWVKPEVAAALHVEMCSLEDVFRRGDVVSLHTPNLPETQGMITGAHLASMKPWSVFINSARGAVVREAEMAATLAQRPDLHAVLDVTIGETPAADAPLLRLSNVTRTPHIAGAMGPECRRMGRFMIAELERWLHGAPLVGGVTREQARIMA